MAAAHHSLAPSVYESILESARSLASTNDLGQVLAQVINALRDLLQADRASVFQYDAATHELFATKAHGLASDLRLPADLGIIGEAAKSRSIVNIPDAYADKRFNQGVDKATGYRTRCLLTVPLVDPAGNLVGVAQVLNKAVDQGGVFTAVDEVIAGHLAVQAAVALKRASLLESEQTKQRLEADLRIARKIQMAAMPDATETPTVEGYEIATSFNPADETGGDAYEVVDLCSLVKGRTEPGVLVFLADATGHGVGPALSVVQVLAMLRVAARLGADVDAMAFHINEQLCADLPMGRFVTAFLGELCPRTHTMRWTSGGQAPVTILRASGRRPDDEEMKNSNGMPFGIDAPFQPETTSPIVFDPGDVFLLLSDGFYERPNAADELYGDDRLRDVAREAMARGGSAQQILDAVKGAVEAFAGGVPAPDDQTAIVIRRVR
jgi:phosphoserine phosphatase